MMMTTKNQWLTLLLCMTSFIAWGQKEHQETLNKSIPLNGLKSLLIDNINGNVTIEGYNGSEIQLEVTKTITAKTTDRLEKGKNEIHLKTGIEDEHIVVYIDAPYLQRNPKNSNKKWWGYDWQDNREDPKYQYVMDMTLKIPYGMEVEARTINNGNIVINHLKGAYLRAVNVNGYIEIDKASGTTIATTVNGHVKVNYVENPTDDSEYKTINGDITVTYQQNLSAELYFKSMNGEFFTDFEVRPITKQPQTIKSNKGNKISIKIGGSSGVTVGEGKLEHHFNTLNGDVYIKQAE